MSGFKPRTASDCDTVAPSETHKSAVYGLEDLVGGYSMTPRDFMLNRPDANAPTLKVGDVFTMPITIQRKWWQFWKPPQTTIIQRYIVAVDVTGGKAR